MGEYLLSLHEILGWSQHKHMYAQQKHMKQTKENK